MGRAGKNIKPEIEWALLRRTWAPGFEDMLEYGVAQQWYNSDNFVDR